MRIDPRRGQNDLPERFPHRHESTLFDFIVPLLLRHPDPDLEEAEIPLVAFRNRRPLLRGIVKHLLVGRP